MNRFFWGLPRTKQGFNRIFFIVDRFRIMTHFVPCKSTKDAPHIAQLFFKVVVRLHDISKTIVSYRDSKFPRTLHKKLGTNLTYSSSQQYQGLLRAITNSNRRCQFPISLFYMAGQNTIMSQRRDGLSGMMHIKLSKHKIKQMIFI